MNKNSNFKHISTRDQWHLFRQQYDPGTKSHFYFNPYTGETLLNCHEIINRDQALWALPLDLRDVPEDTEVIRLYPVLYRSRSQVSKRSFLPKIGGNEVQASVLINSSVRGYLAKRRILKIIQTRFKKIFDSSSGYYYFYDSETGSTSWYKPKLANPSDFNFGDTLEEKMNIIRENDNEQNGFESSYTQHQFTRKLRFTPTKKSPVKKEIVLETNIENANLEGQSFYMVVVWMDKEAPVNTCLMLDQYKLKKLYFLLNIFI